MYSLSQLKRGFSRGAANPAYFGRELNRLYHRRLYQRAYNESGVDVMSEDWDFLIILDACRYDMFDEVADLPGRLERRQSRGTHTREFLRGNFADRDIRDTVYVTASPQLHRWRDQINAQFHAVVNVWREDGWDDTYATVLPETMGEYLRRAADQYPKKRIIGHFIQPHYPFINAEELNSGRLREGEGDDVWGQLMRGELNVSPETVRAAIRDNLEAVLPTVRSLMSDLEGQIVVTSDHGNLLGERARPVPVREWGHPPSVYTEELVSVPWLVYQSGDRREVVSEAAEGHGETIEDSTVEERLQKLGYV